MTPWAMLGAVGAGIILILAWLISLVGKKSKETGVAIAETKAQHDLDVQVVKQAETQAAQVEDQHRVEDKLHSDPEFANVVRDRFSRD